MVFNAGATTDIDSTIKKQVRLTNQISFLLIIASSPYIFLFYFLGKSFISYSLIFVELLFLICIGLNWFKRINASRLLLLLIANLAVFCYSTLFKEAAGTQLLYFSFVAMPLVLFESSEKSKIFFGVSCPVVLYFLLYVISFDLGFSASLSQHDQSLIFFTVSLVSFIILFLCSFFLISENRHYTLQLSQTLFQTKALNTALEKQDKEKSELLSQLDQTIVQLTQETQEKEEALIREQDKLRTIQEQASKIEQDRISIIEKERQEKLLKQGAEVQQQILQPMLPESDYFKLFMAYRPSDFISGDYYRITLERGDYLIALVLDAAGHGAPAALMTGIIAKVLDDVFNHPDQYPLTDPSAMMGILNNLFFKEPRIQKMITGTYMVINLKTRQLMVSSAGGEAPLIRHLDGTITRLNNDGSPLQMDEDEIYTCTEFQLAPGDIVLCYTDGLFDHELLDGTPLIPFDEVTDENEMTTYTYHYDHIEKWLKARPKSKKDIADYLAGKVIENCQTGKDDMTILSIFIV